ncbi:MAG: PP2C family serine/threonine-protein phosphatase [Bacteroidota bacterium]
MKVYHYSHIGTRDNQEDALYCGNGMYLVCDGMGGHAKGEVASNYIVNHIAQNAPAIVTKQAIQETLVSVQEQLNQSYGYEPETTGMGTTFCGIFTSADSLYMAYAGDSRIYWVKPAAGKAWHTWDHSLVGELVKQGEITREEGRKHPMGNRISRAFIANSDNKTVVPDIFRADTIEKGDIFLICSDGVTEAWNDNDLVALLCDTTIDASQKLAIIKDFCAAESKDNNTAILLEAETSDILQSGNNEEIEWLPVSVFGVTKPIPPSQPKPYNNNYDEHHENPNSVVRPVLYIVALLLLVSLIFVLKKILFK